MKSETGSAARGNIYMLLLLAYNLICQTALGVAAKTPAWAWLPESPWIYIASQVAVFGLPFAVYCLVTRSKVSDVLLWGGLSLKNAALIVLMCLLLSPALMLLSGLTSLAFNVSNAAERIMAPFSDKPLILSFLAVGLMPAVFEEITFRGVILTNHRSLGVKAAALLNGLFFGVIHLNIQQFPYAFASGALFSLLVLRSGSIWASVLAHFCMNASQLALNAFPGAVRRLIPEGGAWSPAGFAALGAVAVAAGAGFVVVYRIFGRGKQEKQERAKGIV